MPQLDTTTPAGRPAASDPSGDSVPDLAVLPPPGYAAAGFDEAATNEDPQPAGGPPAGYEAI